MGEILLILSAKIQDKKDYSALTGKERVNSGNRFRNNFLTAHILQLYNFGIKY